MSTTTPPTPNSPNPANGDDSEQHHSDRNCLHRPPALNDQTHPALYVTINYTPQIAHRGGSNTMATGHATSIGSQTAKDSAALVGNQTTNSEHDTLTWSNRIPGEKPLPDRWWQRWRKRGLIVALATIIAAVIAVLTYLGVTL